MAGTKYPDEERQGVMFFQRVIVPVTVEIVLTSESMPPLQEAETVRKMVVEQLYRANRTLDANDQKMRVVNPETTTAASIIKIRDF